MNSQGLISSGTERWWIGWCVESRVGYGRRFLRKAAPCHTFLSLFWVYSGLLQGPPGGLRCRDGGTEISQLRVLTHRPSCVWRLSYHGPGLQPGLGRLGEMGDRKNILNSSQLVFVKFVC